MKKERQPWDRVSGRRPIRCEKVLEASLAEMKTREKERGNKSHSKAR